MMKKNRNRIMSQMKEHHELNEIMDHEVFLSMEKFRHHGNISCLDHTLKVAEIAYSRAKKKNLDYISAARAALLHDFYLYDWHTDSEGFHGFRHPKISLSNAQKYFKLNHKEQDAIRHHMWPMTLRPPRYRESWLVSFADKKAAIIDYKKHVFATIRSIKRKILAA